MPGGLPMAPFRPPSTSYMPRPELPPHLQSLFNPRPPLPFLKVPLKPKCRSYEGIADYVDLMEEGPPPPSEELPKASSKQQKLESHQQSLNLLRQNYDPKEYNLPSDPYLTLFVCRLNFETTESKLEKEFGIYGPIRSINLVRDKQGNSRGYAFIEYENKNDFKNAYKHADGRRIDGRQVLVDFERGRTTRDWHPRRMGGGKGNTRAHRPKGEAPQKVDISYIYDESRGYKSQGRPRSRSRRYDKYRQ